jgi:CHAT domain-containing protein
VILPSLPGVERELDALASTFSGVRTALNEEATEQSFSRAAAQAGVLHVASHAFVNASSPLQNAILLRPDSSSDGVLFLHELQGERNRIPMAVLSSCNTAKGSLHEGEGMEGLQYAFRAMGAESTVSTLWPVADGASVDLMSSFYRHLRSGRSKDEALRQARLDFLEENPQKASPFFWAPTVLYGSPTSLPLGHSLLPAWAWWGGGAVVSVVLLGAIGWAWRRSLPPPFCHGPQP